MNFLFVIYELTCWMSSLYQLNEWCWNLLNLEWTLLRRSYNSRRNSPRNIRGI